MLSDETHVAIKEAKVKNKRKDSGVTARIFQWGWYRGPFLWGGGGGGGGGTHVFHCPFGSHYA